MHRTSNAARGAAPGTAAEAYTIKRIAINEQLRELSRKLDAHAQIARATSGYGVNWAHVSDLQEIEAKLGHALAFLTGEG